MVRSHAERIVQEQAKRKGGKGGIPKILEWTRAGEEGNEARTFGLRLTRGSAFRIVWE